MAEVLSIAGWVGAALVTLWTFGDARPYLRQYIEMQLLADILTGVGIFVVALVIFSTISHLIARVVKGSALNAVDRSLGFLFGLVRGAVLVCLGYLLLTSWVFPETKRPPWLENARMLPWVEQGAEYLKGLVPQEVLAGAIDKAKQEAAPLTGPKTIIDLLGGQGQPGAPANPPANPPAQPQTQPPVQPQLQPAPGVIPTPPTQTQPAPPSNAGASGGG